MGSLTLAQLERGYHVFQEDGDADFGDELECGKRAIRKTPMHAVAVIRKKKVVGYLPRKISRIVALFLKRKGTVRCEMVGRRQTGFK